MIVLLLMLKNYRALLGREEIDSYKRIGSAARLGISSSSSSSFFFSFFSQTNLFPLINRQIKWKSATSTRLCERR